MSNLQLPIEDALLMCFDLETTGVNPAQDRVVQLAVSYFHAHQVVQQHSQLFHPEMPIPEGASAVHGVYDAHVQDAPKLSEFIDRLVPHFRGEVLSRFSSPILVGYNLIAYDIPLFKAELQRIGYDPQLIDLPTIDLFIFAKWHLRHIKPLKLTHLCQHFNVPLTQAHHALFDAKACGFLIPHFINSGYLPRTVGEALSLQKTYSEQIEAEFSQYRNWLYHDRVTGELTMGQGAHLGVSVTRTDPSYFSYCLRKMSDLPPAVRSVFEKAANASGYSS